MLPKTKRKEVIRQIVHLISGIIGLLNLKFQFLNLNILTILLLALLSTVVIINVTKPPKFILRYIRLFERKKPLVGQGILTLYTAYYTLHFISIIAPTSQNASLASMAILTYADSASTLFGVLLKSPPLQFNKRKTWGGLIAGIIFGFLAAVMFITPLITFPVILMVMFVESLDLQFKKIKIDDNLMIPFFSLVLILIFQRIF